MWCIFQTRNQKESLQLVALACECLFFIYLFLTGDRFSLRRRLKNSSRYHRRLMRTRWNERSETKRLSTNLHFFLLWHDIIARSMTSNCALDLSNQLTIFKVTASIRTPGWLVRTLTKALSPFWEERWSGVKPYWEKMKESINTIFPIMCKDKNVIKRITVTKLILTS